MTITLPTSGVFISYAKEDRAAAQAIAQALQARGWGVWWDRKIPPGRLFDEVITEALDGAKCVVVLWSKASVGSEWVKEEATEGHRRGILVPVMIENVTIPLGFRRLQAANLAGWRGSLEDSEFTGFQQAVAQLLGETRVEPRVSESARPAQPRSRAAQAAEPRTTQVTPTASRMALAPLRLALRLVVCAAILLVAFRLGWAAGDMPDAGAHGAGYAMAIPLWSAGLWLTVMAWRRIH